MVDNTFGEKRQTIKTPIIKGILNIILVGLGLFAGITLILANLAIVGIPIAALSLVGVILVIRRQIGRSLTIYEHGIVARSIGSTHSVNYDDLDDLRIQATTRGSSGRDQGWVRAYAFYSDQKHIVTIGSSFPDWQAIGKSISDIVISRTGARFLSRIQEGETIVFDSLKSLGLVRDGSLKMLVSQKGVQLNSDPIIEWGNIQKIDLHNMNKSNATIRIIDQNAQEHKFLYYNSRGSIIAYNLLRITKNSVSD